MVSPEFSPHESVVASVLPVEVRDGHHDAKHVCAEQETRQVCHRLLQHCGFLRPMAVLPRPNSKGKGLRAVAQSRLTAMLGVSISQGC